LENQESVQPNGLLRFRAAPPAGPVLPCGNHAEPADGGINNANFPGFYVNLDAFALRLVPFSLEEELVFW
jgi:hypothetical protein